MGNLSQSFKCMCTITLFTLFLISYTASYSSSSSTQENQLQPQNPSSSSSTTNPIHYHQVFYLKNTDSSTSLSKQEQRFKKRRIKRNSKNMMMMKHRKKMVKNLQQTRDSSRAFSVMLPKGFVPPSGSSPCHNDQPNSVSSFRCMAPLATPTTAPTTTTNIILPPLLLLTVQSIADRSRNQENDMINIFFNTFVCTRNRSTQNSSAT